MAFLSQSSSGQSLSSVSKSAHPELLAFHSSFSRSPLFSAHPQVLGRKSSDRGGNSLKTAVSLYSNLQFFSAHPNPPVRDSTGKADPDYYKLFDESSPSATTQTFQGSGLIFNYNLQNKSKAKIIVSQLDRQGETLKNGTVTTLPDELYVYPRALSNKVFYLKITSRSVGKNFYALSLPVANS